MHPFLNTAIKAAREASRTILNGFDNLDRIKVDEKGLNDLVTSVDRASEEQIIQILSEAYPDHAFLAEESGESNNEKNTAENVWIIDPLDGTMNFAHGFPHFAISIALQHKGQLEIGVIYDPIRQDLFTAQRGGGAQKNNLRMRVSKQLNLKDSLLGTGFPYKGQDDYHKLFACMESLSRQSHSVRRSGSAALDLAYVAAGILDGYWQGDLAPWDIAAGALMVKEAGGLISDFEGDENYLDSGNVVASAPKLFKPILQEVQALK